MAEEFYFQWQNKFLRETIYPRREVKLIDFLVYYREIELWSEYQNRDITAEIQAYHDQKRLAVQNAVSEYYRLRNYYLKADVSTEFGPEFAPLNSVALEKINRLHVTFKTYVPGFTNPRSESFFVSQQIQTWQQTSKDNQKQVASKQRRVFVMKSNNHPNVPAEQAELDAMEKATPMLEEETKRLNKYFAALSRIEKRKLALAKKVEETGRKVVDSEKKLEAVRQQMDVQTGLQRKSSSDLTRLKSPPDAASVKSYFGVPDVPAQIRAKFPLAGKDVVDSLAGFRKSLMDQLSGYKTIPLDKSVPMRLNVLKTTIYNVGQYQRSLEKEILKLDADLRNMGDTWKYKAERQARRDNLRDVGMKAVAEEMDRLADFQTVLEAAGRPKDETDRLIQAKEKELDAITARLAQLQKDAQTLQMEIDSYDDFLIVTEEKRLAEYAPAPDEPVTRRDIVQLKIDEYKACLEQENHYQLLQRVVNEFRTKPGRYPRWLQYMVIHFSGMRYASAHGSWADPKNLLASLKIQAMTEELKNKAGDEIEEFCQDAIENYEPSQVAAAGVGQGVPGLPRTIDFKLKEQVDEPLKQLKRAVTINSTSTQRNALIDLRTEEITYEVGKMQSDDIYAELLSFKDKLPDWMWKDIVKLSPDLRMNQVTDRDWEKPVTPAPGQTYNSHDAELRQILNEWKNKYVTGWREEHDLTKQLIVTRAVCNEVAEHIQHLRGQSPDGGLTAKPKWYQRQENANPQAYFEKPVKPEDKPLFKVGASILWLRFVSKEPNPWQVAEHVSTKKGHFGILPADFPRKDVMPGNTPWSYNRGGPVTRTRMTTGEKGAPVRQTEWLRWMHEATVAELAETANGTVVLTFETALPTDDPSRSAIGVFKHTLDELVFDRGEDNYYPAFLGYVPEAAVPEESLKEMLDWEKVLHRTSDIPQ
jgi:hypothetical protein